KMKTTLLSLALQHTVLSCGCLELLSSHILSWQWGVRPVRRCRRKGLFKLFPFNQPFIYTVAEKHTMWLFVCGVRHGPCSSPQMGVL
uniref:Secreted protein n=1 Tax=Monopterus albus TaxID=43700 RepID=A0A3Q3JGT2_MONAL